MADKIKKITTVEPNVVPVSPEVEQEILHPQTAQKQAGQGPSLESKFLKLSESYVNLIKHLINRRLIPNADLEKITEPLGLDLSADRPGLFINDNANGNNQS